MRFCTTEKKTKRFAEEAWCPRGGIEGARFVVFGWGGMISKSEQVNGSVVFCWEDMMSQSGRITCSSMCRMHILHNRANKSEVFCWGAMMSKSLAESGGAVSMCQVLSFANEKEAERGAPSLSSGPQACERCKRFSHWAHEKTRSMWKQQIRTYVFCWGAWCPKVDKPLVRRRADSRFAERTTWFCGGSLSGHIVKDCEGFCFIDVLEFCCIACQLHVLRNGALKIVWFCWGSVMSMSERESLARRRFVFVLCTTEHWIL